MAHRYQSGHAAVTSRTELGSWKAEDMVVEFMTVSLLDWIMTRVNEAGALAFCIQVFGECDNCVKMRVKIRFRLRSAWARRA